MSRLLPRVLRQRLAFACVSAFLLQACGGEDPQVPTTFAPSGTATSQIAGVVATEVPVAPQVQILDAKGRGIANLRVRWRVGANSGGVGNDSTVTDATGVARSGGWTLGSVAGTQTLTATADGVSPVTFTANVAPGPVAGLVRLSPSTQQATVNSNVAQPPSVRAEDLFGNVVPGATVTFSVATGGGTMEGTTQTTNQNGVATVGAWKLGTGAGQQISRATTINAPQASFSATALAGPPASLVKIAGDNQEGTKDTPLIVAPGVRVLDGFQNPVGNVPVSFTPGANSGTVTGGIAQSDPATGNAFVGSWSLGPAATQTLIASSSSIPGQSVSFTATAVESSFRIEVRFIGDGGTAAVRQAFIDAASKWRRVIVASAHRLFISVPAGACLPWTPALSETVTDLVIFARIGSIDGPGQVAARAGWCGYSTQSRLPFLGAMEFDEADVTPLLNNGTFTNVVLHEMGHVLGIGTMWNEQRSLLADAGSAEPYFTGTAARAAFSAINTVTFSGNPVPVEGNARPIGTRDSHWRESVFGSELMQGFVKVGGMPLSRVTVASLQDLGYVVNLSAADPFTITAPLLAGFPSASVTPRTPFPSVVRFPVFTVDRSGRMIKPE